MRSLKSILIKYFSLLLFAVLILASGIEWLQYRAYVKHFEAAAIDKTNILANNLQATLLFESKKDFEDLAKDTDSKGILLYDSKNKLFAGKGEIFEVKDFKKSVNWHDGYLITKSDVVAGSELLGTLYIKYTTDKMYDLIQSQLIWILIGYSLLIIFFLFIAKFIDSQLTTPVKKLSDFVKRISTNDNLSLRVQIESNNTETTDLKESFNRLLDNIEEKNSKLSDLNLNLENKVNAKTEELQSAIEDLKKFQNQIIAQEKLASLGSLAAGIAHEIKNPINLINNSALIIEMFSSRSINDYKDKINNGKLSQEDIEELFSDLDDIVTASRIISANGKRADGIIRSMLLLSRSQKATSIDASFSHHLDQALNLSFHAMRAKQSSIDVIINKEIQETPETLCFPQDLERAFVNIFDNAFYAMKERKKSEQDYKAQLDVDLQIEDEIAIIRIKDNGVGIPQTAIKKIFEPFYTTKPTGSGTGLGMSMVNDIIIAHKGELSIDSSEGEYTKISIKLPLD
jgi:signal transduction histidine kinase